MDALYFSIILLGFLSVRKIPEFTIILFLFIFGVQLFLLDSTVFTVLVEGRGGAIRKLDAAIVYSQIILFSTALIFVILQIITHKLTFSNHLEGFGRDQVRVKGASSILFFLTIVMFGIIFLLGKKGAVGTLVEGLSPIFLFFLLVFHTRSRLSTAIILMIMLTFLLVGLHLRSLLVSSWLIFAFTIYSESRINKIHLLFVLCIGFMLLAIAGIYRFGFDAVTGILNSGQLVTRLIFSNFAGATASALYYVSEIQGESFSTQSAILLGHYIPAPSILLPDDFVLSNALDGSIPGGGATLGIFLGFGPFGPLSLFFSFMCIFYIIRRTSLPKTWLMVFFALLPDFWLYGGKIIYFYYLSTITIWLVIERLVSDRRF